MEMLIILTKNLVISISMFYADKVISYLFSLQTNICFFKEEVIHSGFIYHRYRKSN